MGMRQSVAMVLVVDDDDDIREAFAEIVQIEGCEVAMASNGREALDFLRTHPAPALVLLDLTMPLVDGWQVLAEMKANASLATIPICVVSAIPQEVPGADVVLLKPVKLSRLVEVVHSFCGC
jgi:CheY-like chemotaxis protein